MNISGPIIKLMIISSFVIFIQPSLSAQSTETVATMAIDMQQARVLIENTDKQFSKDFKEGDSLALAAHYTKDAEFGSLKGEEILSYWAKSIRNSIKSKVRNIKFTTSSLTNDGEFLVELGTYEMKDDQDELKSSGKYLVVWKQEDGIWKIYRDIAL
jgi:ketosteroid isomerase-like protein